MVDARLLGIQVEAAAVDVRLVMEAELVVNLMAARVEAEIESLVALLEAAFDAPVAWMDVGPDVLVA